MLPGLQLICNPGCVVGRISVFIGWAKMTKTFRFLIPVLACVTAFPAFARATPRLGVVIVLDQFCAEHLTRYAPLFGGGLHRLIDGGILFTDAHHDHAMTLTATGHATIATGCYPNRHGIVGNNWVERATGQRVYCCTDTTVQIFRDPEASGCSPRYLMRPALGDWLKEARPGAKAFAVSQKDRSAIMLGGQNPDAAFWFDDVKGRFVTSTYYIDSLPAWVAAYDCFPFREMAIREGWRKSRPESAYLLASEDDSPAENDGIHTTFPHLYDSVAAIASTPSEWMVGTPFSDLMLLDFARTLIVEENLGKDSIPDLLCISLSATDYIGHSFGPFSQEVLDGLLRADDALSHFFEFLDSTAGAGQYTIVLSSDHGVMPLPEESVRSGNHAERISRGDAKQHLETAVRQIADAAGLAQSLIIGQTNGLILDTKAAEVKGIRPPDLRAAVAEAVRKIDYVADAMTYEDLTLPDGDDGGYREMYRHSFHPDRTPDVVIRYKEHVLVLDSKFGTTHGTPYHYDTHVPVLFYGAGVGTESRIADDRIRTIDIAPTMAELLGIPLPEKVDGAVLRRAVAEAGR